MQNKTLSLVIVLVALLIGGYFLLSKPKDVTAPPVEEKTVVQNIAPAAPAEVPVAASAPKRHEITYTANGFSPAVLNIAAGDTVVFANKSGESFRPASNPHPMHSDYSEFDARAKIDNEKTYEFTFTKPGAWGYHDHLNSKMMGVVVVKSL